MFFTPDSVVSRLSRQKDRKMYVRKLLLGWLGLQILTAASAARILAPFFFPGKSHFMMTNAIIRELVKRGHQVTFITPFSLAKEQLGANYTEILIPEYDFWPFCKEFFQVSSVIEMSDVASYKFIEAVNHMGTHGSDFALEQPAVKALIDADQKLGKYDLLLAEQFYNEPALMLGHIYELPTVTISTFGYMNYMSQMTGLVSPWSYVPHTALPLSDRMTFTERVMNTLLSAWHDIHRMLVYFPQQQAIVAKHFRHLSRNLPSIRDLERNISIILLNVHAPIVTPRPTAFNMVHVGGLHIVAPKPLPAKLQRFMDEAQHGVIYFSLGTQVRSSDMPPEKRQVFLDVFSHLKQRVLWKFEDEDIPELPPNVMVQKWMPQNDILAHRNVKVFITHGGLFGTQEAIYHGVPMLGMPVYHDQYTNTKRVNSAGYGLLMDYRYVTAAELKSALLQLLDNPKYRENVARASRIYRDRPLGALDTAIYWIEYVIEHQGTPHLISAALDLSWYQFYLVDVVLLLLLLGTTPILGLYFLYLRTRKAGSAKATNRAHKHKSN